jgi:hypothetical protein
VLSLFRRFPLVARSVALVLLGAGWMVPLAFPHVGDDDAVCVGVLGAQTNGPQIGATEDGNSSDHCAVCHALRSFRNAGVNQSVVAFYVALERCVRSTEDPLYTRPIFAWIPARAPPA